VFICRPPIRGFGVRVPDGAPYLSCSFDGNQVRSGGSASPSLRPRGDGVHDIRAQHASDASICEDRVTARVGPSQYTIGDVWAYRAGDTAASERSRIISVIPGKHGARCNDQLCDDLALGALADAQVGVAGFLDLDAGVAQRLDGPLPERLFFEGGVERAVGGEVKDAGGRPVAGVGVLAVAADGITFRGAAYRLVWKRRLDDKGHPGLGRYDRPSFFLLLSVSGPATLGLRVCS
jgi:hypothetical protein